MYIYFLRIYLEKEIWNLIQFCETTESFDENFSDGKVDLDINQTNKLIKKNESEINLDL